MNVLRRGLAAGITATLIGVPISSQADPLFQAAYESYDVGVTQSFFTGGFESSPAGIATGDMNGDGFQDLVVTASGAPAGAFTGSTVSVLLRRASAATPALFLPKINSSTSPSTGPIAVAVGDVNGDGKLDAVTADFGSNTITVLLGDGAGHLTFLQQKTAGTQPRGVALGDLNGDGLLDVVAANGGSNTISTWLNTGGGNLGSRNDLGSLGEPRGIVVGNFNADTALDVISCNRTPGVINVYLNQNNGTGNLNAGVGVPTGNKPTAIATGFLDANATLDVAVACSSRVIVRLGNGAGGFTGAGALNLGISVDPLAISVGDYTGAATPDIAVAGATVTAGMPNVAVIPDVSGLSSGTVSYSRGGPTPWGIGWLPDPPSLVVANTGNMAAAEPTHTVSVLRRSVTGGFGSSIEVFAGVTSDRVASLDFNRDGILDLIISGPAGSGLMSSQGFGDGTFQVPQNVSYGSGVVSWVASVDANRDGAPDVLYAVPAAAEIRRVLSNGGGGFNAPAVVASGFGEPCATGDVNRDGKADFIACNGNQVQAFLGSGDGAGSFVPGPSFTLAGPSNLRAITLGDWNRDAKLDIAISADTGVLRYLGVGDGSFTSATTLLSAHSIRGGAAADVNLDGLPDLIVTDEGTSPITGSSVQGVTVLPGNGLGGFGTPLLFPALDIPGVLAVADVNRDGKPDLIGKNSFTVPPEQQSLSVLLGDGVGDFGARTDYAAGSSPLGFALGDFNRDGRVDVAGSGNGAIGTTAQGVVSILRNAAPGSFGTLGARTDYANVGVAVAGIARGDVDRDGRMDAVMVGTIAGAPYLGTLHGDGVGGFLGGSIVPLTGVDPRSVVLGDLNRDDRIDAVIGNGNSANFYVCLGTGSTFGAPGARITGNPPIHVAIGDFNRDGILDVITANPSFQDISILTGAGDGTFSGPALLSSVNGVTGIGVGDLNHDSILDIVATGGGTGTARVHLGLPSGNFQLNGNTTIGPGTISPVFADFNRDGTNDVVIGSTGGGGRISVCFSNTSGQLSGPVDYALTAFPTQVAVGDVNGDGTPDVVASMQGRVSVFMGAGGPGGGLLPPTSYTALDAKGVVIADMNRDGRPDVVTGNAIEANASVFLNGGSVPTGVAVQSVPPAKASLWQNAPNPFNPRTSIRFSMPRAGVARLVVFDAAGRRVATLLDGPVTAGERRIEWNGRDDSGHAAASGIYFYKLEADGAALSRRMVLLK